MLKRREAGVVSLLVLALAAPLGAQRPQRAMYVSALDESGNPVQSLAETDITIREDRVQREVLSVLPATEPMQIALLVDNSAASESSIRDYREALTAFINDIGADESGAKHEIALITVGERPTINTDYTTDLARVRAGAGRIFATPGSGSYLLNGFIEVSQGIVKRASTRPVIVAVSTEGPELSDRVYQSVLEPLRSTGAALFIEVIGRPVNQDQERSVVFDRGTKESGGRLDTVLISSGLTARMKQLARELTHQWKVTYSRPESLIPPEDITVTPARPGLTVRGTPVKEARDSR
jgi:hypothetical protein